MYVNMHSPKSERSLKIFKLANVHAKIYPKSKAEILSNFLKLINVLHGGGQKNTRHNVIEHGGGCIMSNLI